MVRRPSDGRHTKNNTEQKQCRRYDLIERSSEQPTGRQQATENGTAEVKQMQRFIVVGDVETRRVVSQPT